MAATRLIAAASRGTMPFHVPLRSTAAATQKAETPTHPPPGATHHTFSQLS